MVRGWRLVLVAVAALGAAVAVTLVAVAVNALTGGSAGWYRLVERHPLWWTVGATAAAAVTALVVWRVQAWYDRRSAELVPSVQQPEPWVVDRPAEVNQIVAALRRKAGGTVGITTAVQGAGGFGKTTIAKMVRADRRVLRRFSGRVYWVTLGRDAESAGLVAKVNDLIRRVDPERAQPFADVRQAAEHLAAVLAAGPRRLVILDDVWFGYQLAAFPVAGKCVRLITTRVPSLVAGLGEMVKVDQMSVRQTRALLCTGLPPLPDAVIDELLDEARRWPLLLRLLNKILVQRARLLTEMTAAAEELLAQLRGDGALLVDKLNRAADQHLDVSDPNQRAMAVAATLEASMGVLLPGDRDRLAELATFAEDETIPVSLAGELWRATAGVEPARAPDVCQRLSDLALLTSTASRHGGTISLHDVVRDYLAAALGRARVAELHQLLLGAVAARLPSASPPPALRAGDGKVAAWWQLPDSDHYLWDHLVEHLHAAGNNAELVAADLRWIGARLEHSDSPVAPSADLARLGTSRARRLQRTLNQIAHLLTPTEPPHFRLDILYSRVAHDPDWNQQAHDLAQSSTRSGLVNRWPLPDLPDPALRLSLAVDFGAYVQDLAVAPDGSWLVTVGSDGAVRIWDTATGLQRTALASQAAAVRWIQAVAIAPDGTWLMTAAHDGSVRVWDPATGLQRTALARRAAGIRIVRGVAIAPGGSCVATISDDRVQIRDIATGKRRVTLAVGHDRPEQVLIAPDGSWLVTASERQEVRIYDAVTGEQRAAIGERRVKAAAIAPDGSWLVTTGADGLRAWDAATGERRAVLVGTGTVNPLEGIGHVQDVAIAPDGSWLVTAAHGDGTVRIWDVARCKQRAALGNHTDGVRKVAVAPDGSWLVTAGSDGLRIWDTGPPRFLWRPLLAEHD